MIVVVFRSRLREEAQEEYQQWAKRMSEIARTLPGYVSHKRFVADDGEAVTIVEFESEESLRGWSRHPDHVEAKRNGRDRFYAEYKVQVCAVLRASAFPSRTDAPAAICEVESTDSARQGFSPSSADAS